MPGAADSCPALRLPVVRSTPVVLMMARPQRLPTDSHDAIKPALRRLLEVTVGTTRWASPPPSHTVRTLLLLFLLSTAAFAVLALGRHLLR